MHLNKAHGLSFGVDFGVMLPKGMNPTIAAQTLFRGKLSPIHLNKAHGLSFGVDFGVMLPKGINPTIAAQTLFKLTQPLQPRHSLQGSQES